MTTPVLDVTNPASAQAIGGELVTDVTAFAAQCAVTITTVADYEVAMQHRSHLGEFRKRVEAYFAEPKGLAYRLWKTLCARENEVLAHLDAPDRQLAAAMSAFKREQDRLRQEQEAAEAAQRLKEEQDAAALEAARLEAQGEHQVAAAMVEEAIAAPPPVVAKPDVLRSVGAKFSRRWMWKFAGGPKDVAATPPEVIAKTMKVIPPEFLMVDTVKVGAYVRSMKSSGSIPGIDVFYEDIPVR